MKYLEQQAIEAITEVVPSYRAVMIHFDQTKINAQELIDTLNLDNLDLADIEVSESSKIVYIPVVYGENTDRTLKQ